MQSQRSVIILIAAIAVGAVVIWLLRPQSATAPTGVMNANTNATENTNTALTNDAHIPASLLGVGKARDDRRLEDIRTLQTGLEAYKIAHENGEYPAELSGLVPDYAASLPKDPLTNADYDYTPIGTDLKFYELEFVLEVGVNDLDAGTHTASPEEIPTQIP